MGHGFHPFWIFPGMFFLFVIIMMVLRIVFYRRFGWGHHHHCYDSGNDAEAILKRRLVNGEIGEEEYTKLLGILRK